VGLAAIAMLMAGPGGASPAGAQSVSAPTVLERDLNDLLAWFDGQFSNWRQVRTAAVGEAPPWVLARISSAEVAGVDAPQRWLELSLGARPDEVVQRRLYTFFVDVGADAVVMRTWEPRPEAGMPATVDDLQPLEGCDIVWRHRGAGFEGVGNPDTCRSTADDRGVAVQRVMRLERDRLELLDRPVEETSADPEPPMTLYRAERYTGTVRLPGDDAGRTVEMHDEGARTKFEGDAAAWEIGLATAMPATGAGERLELTVSRRAGDEAIEVASVSAPAGARHLELTAAGLDVELGLDPELSRDVATLAEWLTGSFSSAAQAAADESFFDIRLHMQPIWSDRDDGPWLYVEQAVATAQDSPYRQRVYRLREVEPGLLESAVFTLPDPEAAVGAWRDPDRLAGVAPADLEPRGGCSILLRRAGDAFVGSTLGTLCPSDLRGARYASSEVRVTRDRLVSWDRGFDASGTQVWGARTGGYVFDRMAGSVDEPPPDAAGPDAGP
jgi:hypothetical protein